MCGIADILPLDLLKSMEGKYGETGMYGILQLRDISDIQEALCFANEARKAQKLLSKAAERPTIETPEGFKLTPVIINALGFDVESFNAFILEIPPGQKGFMHRHSEAIKFILSGKGKEYIGDKPFITSNAKFYEYEPGDAVFIPRNTWHQSINTGDEPLKILAVAMTNVPAFISTLWAAIEFAPDLVKKYCERVGLKFPELMEKVYKS